MRRRYVHVAASGDGHKLARSVCATCGKGPDMRRRPALPSGPGCLQLQWGLHVERENCLPGLRDFWKKPCLHPCLEKHAEQEHEVCA